MRTSTFSSLKVLLTTLILVAGLCTRAQTLALSVSNSTLCTLTSTNQVFCSITATVSGASYYTYSVNTNFGLYSAGASTALTSTLNIVATGPYTVYCNAYGSSTAVVLGTASATGTIISGVTPTITTGPNNGNACLGTTFTMTANGASSYTWSGPSVGTQTGNSVVVTPTASGCYTVIATSANGCTNAAVKCLNVGMQPTLTTSASQTTVCMGSPVTISVSGANSYSCTNASVSGTIIYANPTVSTCYTITGYANAGCSNTAVVCVSVVPGPTVTTSASSSALCLGSGLTFTAGGAVNYTWSVYTGTSIITSTLSSFSYTPPIAGAFCGTLTANNGNGCDVYSYACYTVSGPSNVTISPNYSVCGGYQVVLVAGGANSYTWSNGATTPSIVVTPTANTCYTVMGLNLSCGGTSSAVTCVSIVPVVTLNITGPTTVCPNSINSYTVTGAGSYTWVNAWSPNISLGTGSVVNISSQNNCFTAYGSGFGNGCPFSQTTLCLTYFAQPTVLVSSSPSLICQGSTATLTATGATSYTWSNGTMGASIVVSPTASICYSVIGSNGACNSSAANTCLTVLPAPIISVSGNNVSCPGSPNTLIASGASTYTWSNSSIGATIAVSPTASTCYSVIGTSGAGCSATAVKCMSVYSVPALSIAGNNTVCYGSSVTYTASGGNTYTWSTGANTSTINVTPTTSVNYTLMASNSSNSCISTSTVALTVFTNCAIVWPGDANRDGVVDNSDVLELGLASSLTGAARSGANISWTGQYATTWVGTVSTGWNACHADCNGDGLVNAADTAAISANFSLTHSFKPSSSSSLPDLYLSPKQPEAYAGVWNVVNIVLGDNNNPVNQLYGIVFDLDYDNSMVQPDSVKLIYTNSFLNSGSNNIEFAKTKFNTGKLFAASVKTNGTNASPSQGIIGEFWYKLKPGISEGTPFTFGISNGEKINSAGIKDGLIASGSMNLNTTNNLTGIKNNALTQVLRIFPNPANTTLFVSSSAAENSTYSIMDLSGRELLKGSLKNSAKIDVTSLSEGVYMIRVSSENGISTSKFVVAHN